MNALTVRKIIQGWLGVSTDGVLGSKSLKAFRDLAQVPAGAEWPEAVHSVWATSFADPKDIAAFKRCKEQGKTDKQCFAVGDNGIGTPRLGEGSPRRGVDTTQDRPMCALPPEDWEPLGEHAPGALVLIKYRDKQVVAELRDTMPRKAAIKNGAGIDLNPAACAMLGLVPPVRAEVTWQFV